MKKTNIYSEYVDVSPELCSDLKSCILTHASIYNYTLGLLENSENIQYKELKKIVTDFIKTRASIGEIGKYLLNPLFNEIYYQYKKFANRNRKQKALFNIQYLTFLANQYNNKAMTLTDGYTLMIHGLAGYMTLHKPLPPLQNDNKLIIYINISYSILEDKFRLSIFK